ncbi:hypothetical protein ACFV3O_04225, partial [Streptomyces albidoflavus]
MTVLVLTCEEDVTADAVVLQLRRRGVPVLRLDPGEFPGRVEGGRRPPPAPAAAPPPPPPRGGGGGGGPPRGGGGGGVRPYR